MRAVLELPNEPDLRQAYRTELFNPSPGVAGLRSILPRFIDIGGIPFEIADLPSLSRRFRSTDPRIGFGGDAGRLAEERLEALVFSLEVESIDALERLAAAARKIQGARVGIDLPLATFDCWCPGRDRPPLFHTRDTALGLIRAEALTDHAPPLQGSGVNIVLIDLGVNRDALLTGRPGLAFAGGWAVTQGGSAVFKARPDQGPFDGHGTMVARNILSLAPQARLFDFPLLPERVTEVVAWTSWAQAALHRVRADIGTWLAAAHPGPWVLCNAWGIYDRRQEVVAADHPANYTGNPSHLLNQLVASIDANDGHDQVFAAGNGGQFCPHPLCGPGDTGPGNSIFGASSSPAVLTAGAVRADGMWIGYSSQGPGQPAFSRPPAFSEKPDLCAPSHFVEGHDARMPSTGTSAACGVMAGAVAALRSTPSPLRAVSSGALRQHLRSTARQPPGATGEFDLRYGFGILDLERALSEIKD